MRYLSLFLAVIFLTACGHLRSDIVQLGDTADLIEDVQLSLIEVPVYYIFNVKSNHWMDRAYNAGSFGLANREDIFDAAVLQGIVPTKLVEYDSDEANRDSMFVLLIFDETDEEKGKLAVQIFYELEATPVERVSLKKRVSTINKYCFFWWEVRHLIKKRQERGEEGES